MQKSAFPGILPHIMHIMWKLEKAVFHVVLCVWLETRESSFYMFYEESRKKDHLLPTLFLQSGSLSFGSIRKNDLKPFGRNSCL